MPSATFGMNLGQRIAHVGGRTKEDHCIEFGSVLAVATLLEHMARDIVAGQPAHSTDPITKRIEAAEKRHGGLRQAARALGIDPGYLFRLKNAEKMNPSDEVLAALGLERVIFYRQAEEQP